LNEVYHDITGQVSPIKGGAIKALLLALDAPVRKLQQWQATAGRPFRLLISGRLRKRQKIKSFGKFRKLSNKSC
jgi:hypothetical protein